MNNFLDSLIREIEYECYHTCLDRNADRHSDRDSDRDSDEEMPGLVHDLDTDDEDEICDTGHAKSTNKNYISNKNSETFDILSNHANIINEISNNIT